MSKKLKLLLILCIIIIFPCGCVQLEVSDAEKQMFVTVEDLKNYGVDYSEEHTGTFSKIFHTIEYKYDSPNLAEVNMMAIISTAEFHRTILRAKKEYNDGVSTMKTGALLGKAKLEHQPDFVNLGDQTYFAYLKKQDVIVGNYIIVRREKRLYSLFIVGIDLGDPEQVEKLLLPKLLLMDEYEG